MSAGGASSISREGHCLAQEKDALSLDGTKIGQLTSGAPSPSLGNTGVGIGYISGVSEGDEVLIAASPRSSVRAVIIRPPLYRRPSFLDGSMTNIKERPRDWLILSAWRQVLWSTNYQTSEEKKKC